MENIFQINWFNNLPYTIRKKKDPEEIRQYFDKKIQSAHLGQWLSAVWFIATLLVWWLANLDDTVLIQLFSAIFIFWMAVSQRRSLTEAKDHIDDFVQSEH